MYGGGSGDLPDFGRVFGLLNESQYTPLAPVVGEARPVEFVEPSVVRFLGWPELSRIVANYIEQYVAGQYKEFRSLKPVSDIKNCLEYFRLTAPVVPIHDVKFVTEKSSTDLTFKRLPFDFAHDASLDACPTFQSLLRRMEYGKESFMKWVGSLFDEQSDKSQYCYLFGEGGSGKSTIERFLRSILGSACVVVQPPQRGDRFWFSNISGKRLVIMSDVSDYKVVSSSEVKILTGDSTAFIEHKGAQGFNAPINAKLLLCSNHAPGISSKWFDVRRIIAVKMLNQLGQILSVEEMQRRLVGESQAFLSVCWKAYQSCGKDPIKLTEHEVNAIQEISDENEAPFRQAFDDFLFADPDISITINELNILAEQYRWKDKMLYGFRKWLVETRGAKYMQHRIRGTQDRSRRAYFGVGVKREFRKGFGCPTPQWPVSSEREIGHWKDFLVGLGHKFDGNIVQSVKCDENMLPKKEAKRGDTKDHLSGHDGLF